MNWTVSYRLRRETPATPAELDALARHSRAIHSSLHDYDLVIAVEAVDDDVIAHGQLERYYDPDDNDVRLLLDALTQLRSVLPDGRVEVHDDYDLIGWNGTSARFDLMGHCDVPRFDLPSPSGSRRKVSDLPDDHEFSPPDWTARPVAVAPVARDDGADVALHLPEAPVFKARSEGYWRQLSVQTWVHNPHGVLARLQRLRVVLRDAEGRALDVLDEGLHQLVAEVQFLSTRCAVSPGSLREAREAELWLEYDYEVRQLLARLSTAPLQPRLDETYRLAASVTAEDIETGPLALDVTARVFHGHHHDGFLQVLLELTPRFSAGGLSGQVRVLAKDETGMALGADEVSVAFPTDGSAPVVALSIDLPRTRIDQVRHLEIDLEASRDLLVHLGRFALGLPAT